MAVARLDQGYGWVVTFACFVVCFIMAGLARASGVLYVAVIELYGCSREAASAPFSVRFSVRNLAGPIIGVLGQRYGIRAIVVSGGILAGIGGALCALAPDVFWLTVFWGGIHGFGYGLCNLIHVMILNQYFNKYKGTALGLALSGDCVGTFAFPMILELLIENYGVTGTFLILGGIALNVVPAGMLMRSPDWEITHKRKGALNGPIICKTKGNLAGILNRAYVLETLSKGAKSGDDYVVNPHLASYLETNDSLRISNTLLNEKPLCKDARVNSMSKDENRRNSQPPLLPLEIVAPELCDKSLKVEQDIVAPDSKTISNSNVGYSVFNETNCEANINMKSQEYQPVEPIKRNAVIEFLLVNIRPMFLLIALTLGAFQFLFISVVTIIIDHALDIGISSEGSKYLVIGFSVADLIGRLAFGGVLDKQLIKISHFAGLTTLLMGISVLAMPASSNYYYLMSCMTLCGLVMGGNCIMYPILVEEYMEKKVQTMAIGSMNFYGGLMIFSLTPMIGFFRDSMGSYNGVFWSVGSLASFSGLLWILEPYLRQMQQRPKN
ncbi:hypothetical protein JTE90_007556 [Oedothorax gibbosus]|uniref:Uncharacterized protein n=1 Tax=Oedothorax gibbosus TaxID=931172 RepID=A0AAV6VKG7_9ARAC|nr:hypothetical protein JTE90_007556 [Oedothorax gibbosus]